MKRIKLLLLAACVCTLAHAAEWIDVTDTYITNPRFDNGNTNGWTMSWGAQNAQTGYGGMEFWNGWFSIYQSTNLPNGSYRLSVQAYYRTGNDNTAYYDHQNNAEYITAYLDANGESIPLVSVYSDYLISNEVGGCFYRNYRYYPSSMESGAYCFNKGMYNNDITVEVTDGTLNFGIYCYNVAYSGNWCMMDNFKLEYYGEVTPVTGITLSSTSLSLVEGESAMLTATVKPDNATYKKLDWYSSKPQIADVDEYGNVTAYQSGTAYIYAKAIDDSGKKGSCRVTVTKSTPTAENIIINEIQSANIDMYVDPSYNYGGWVELYNPTSKAVSLNNLYISDDANNLTKFNLGRNRGVIPANGYHVLWFDHYNFHYSPSQIDFKLDYDGGAIYLSDSEGNLITSFEYPVGVARTSYARTSDGGDEWGYTSSPTPAASNASSTFASERLEAPVVDKDACLFTKSFTVNVEIPEGTTLRYTTDGTTPSLSNGYTSQDGRFDVSSTTTFRFGLFQEGMLPSQIVTRSYIYRDQDYSLPIVSVVTNPDNLYDDMLGAYVRGTNGRTGNGQRTPCNWNMDWDRPVNFEFITPDGGMVVNQEVDFSMCGGWSRAFEPHSFKLKANKIYEEKNSIDYPFFAEKPYLKHKTLQIRNGGNDYNIGRMKDLALQEIVHTSGLDVDGQASLPVMHFINGEYKGMLNIREPNNKHYAYANWGIDSEEMDQFEMSPDSGYVQMEGTREAFLEWYDLSANAAYEETYEAIRNLVDIDEYINYMAVEFYLGGLDWPQNNIKGFRPRIENGRFRFVLFDLDGALNTNSPFNTFEGKQTYTFDLIYDTNSRFTEEIEFVTIFLNMLQNDSFRKQFIDTYCLVAGSVFENERCNAIITEQAEMRVHALSLEELSPYSTANDLINRLTNRQSSMINALVNYERMNLSSNTKLTVSIESNVEDAVLRLNDIAIPTGKFSGALFAPITLKAEPKAGYRFIGWSNTNSVSEQATTLFGRGSEWSYYDQGSLDDYNWESNTYNASSWKKGSAPLGYYTSDAANERGYNTPLDFGTDAANKRPTYYFRKSFQLSEAPTADDKFVLDYTIDDGMVIYINGTEAARYLMPAGTISYSTYASTYANNNPDNGSIILDATLFRKGTNVIAIEVHNNNATSTDIYLDAALTRTSIKEQGQIVCEESEYTLPSNEDLSLVAMYAPLTSDELNEMKSLPVRINEISADNSIYINDLFKRNDWIELYNTTAEPVDVAGMYLSDNTDKLTKYQITGGNGINTVIAPYDYLIIWADKPTAQTVVSQLHASFKLAAEGGCVALTAADKSWSDILYYEPHLGTESVGLYPDGHSDVYMMNTPTIAQANVITSYASKVDQSGNSSGSTPIIDLTEDNLKLNHHGNMLHIYGAESSWATITVYSTQGQACLRATATLTNGYAAISLSTLPEGVYIASVTSSNGETQTLKFFK